MQYSFVKTLQEIGVLARANLSTKARLDSRHLFPGGGFFVDHCLYSKTSYGYNYCCFKAYTTPAIKKRF
jgi:hypothetical protein